MKILSLTLLVLFLSLQHITKKLYNTRTNNGTYTFAFVSVATAMLCFTIPSLGRLSLNTDVVLYAIAFALTYSLASVTSVLAVANGMLSLTSLITAFSLIVPTVYGLSVLGEPVSITLIAGLSLLAVCLILIKHDGNAKILTRKWAVYVVLAFLGNGICSTVQKAQQVHCTGMYKTEFMVVALSVSAVILLGVMLSYERKSFVENVKTGGVFAIACGVSNAVVNYIVMAISLTVPASVMFPVMSVGSIMLTSIISILIFGEVLSKHQKLGIITGLVSLVLLNL